MLVPNTCCLSLIAALILVLGDSARSQEIINDDSPGCQGIFDFYFVLDGSGSVKDVFHSEIVPFVSNVTDQYVEPDFRIAVVTFSSDSIIHLNLTRTADRSEIEAGVQRLKDFTPDGVTFLAPGLENVNNLIASMGGDAASVILVLTDGRLADENPALEQANLARSKGASIFTIGIGKVNKNQLSMIADDEDQVYIGSDFEYLNEVLGIVVNKTCVEITSVTPNRVCIGDTTTVTLKGKGFTNFNHDQSSVVCRFKTSSDQLFETNSTDNVEYNRIVCLLPNFTEPENFLLQVSPNGGLSFISSNVSMETSECKGVNAGVVVGALAGTFLVALLALLCLLWFFLPLITCTIRRKSPTPIPEKPPPPKGHGTPGKKWAVVDASYYGGRGAGGINQMKVHWGKKGATEEGSKLDKAKDANIIDIVSKAPVRPPQPTRAHVHSQSTPGCWDITKAKFSRWYAVAASYRPVFTVNGRVKHINWCPGKSNTEQNGVHANSV